MRRLEIISLIIILLVACSRNEPGIQQGNCKPFYYSDTYQYPVLPGTDEWKKLNSLAEKVAVCQIPYQKLKSISTEGLLETLLSYPLIIDYVAFDEMQVGFNRIKTENNGFAELYERKNVYDVIYERYNLMSFDCEKNIYPPKTGDQYAPIGIAAQTLEFFIYQNDFLGKLEKDKKIAIFHLIYNKHIQKTEDKFANFGKLVSAAIMGKIMYGLNYKPFVDNCQKVKFIPFFIENIPTYRPSDVNPINIIEQYAKDFETLKFSTIGH